jgi:peptidoglycan/xylan/chitin deacetylase (PgdA/CDA1 family)
MRLPVLMYHRVAADGAERRYTVTPRRFRSQMTLLRDRGYQGVSLDAVLDALGGRGALPARSVAITFDDGFLETFEQACPILRDLGFPAAFFLVTGFMGKDNAWMAGAGYRSSPLLGWGEAATLVAEGFTVGSHSVGHPSLDELDAAAAEREIVDSRSELEDRLGVPVRHFAYPFGRCTARERELVARAGYAGACSVQAGFNNATTDPYALRRLDVFGSASDRTFARNIQFGENEMTTGRVLGYYARRLVVHVSRRG